MTTKTKIERARLPMGVAPEGSTPAVSHPSVKGEGPAQTALVLLLLHGVRAAVGGGAL